jgi:PAS domain S-box-containing protein
MKGEIAQRVTRTGPALAIVRYGGAAVAAAIGVLLANWLQPVLDASVVLLMSVLVAAWFSGFWPAAMASVLATLALDFFFTEPLYTFSVEGHLPRLVVFLVTAGVFVSVSAARREAERSLARARDELEMKVNERTADLTRTHAKVLAAQQRFLDLVNSIEGVVWEADARTLQFTFVSRQAERILGYPVEQWLREPTFWQDHIHPDDRQSAVSACLSAAAQKRDRDFEYRMVSTDGGIVWVRDLVTVVVENGTAGTLRGVIFDITSKKREEEEIGRA